MLIFLEENIGVKFHNLKLYFLDTIPQHKQLKRNYCLVAKLCMSSRTV